MGIVNVTPDSFSEPGAYLSVEAACNHAHELIEQGADIIDVGGESTRPGAKPLSLEEELARVIPVIQGLRKQTDIAISIDTYKPEVMQAAVAAGANLINDIYALRQKGALAMAAKLAVPVVLMHMQAEPETMQDNPSYPEGVLADIVRFWQERILACAEAGIEAENIILDPGFGFGKTVNDNMQILQQWKDLQRFPQPLLLGVSRKSTIGKIINQPVENRMVGGIALTVCAAMQGLQIIRTHDVDETNQALQMLEAVYSAKIKNKAESYESA